MARDAPAIGARRNDSRQGEGTRTARLTVWKSAARGAGTGLENPLGEVEEDSTLRA